MSDGTVVAPTKGGLRPGGPQGPDCGAWTPFIPVLEPPPRRPVGGLHGQCPLSMAQESASRRADQNW